jgi:hypothetical protein
MWCAILLTLLAAGDQHGQTVTPRPLTCYCFGLLGGESRVDF